MAGWKPDNVGHWDLQIDKAGLFDIKIIPAAPAAKGSILHVRIADRTYEKKVEDNDPTPFLGGIDLPAGPIRLEAWFTQGDAVRGPRLVELLRKEDSK